MKIRLLILFSFTYFFSSAQTKKVVFEEICGANCGNCPSGAWIVDSLAKKYSNLIGVSIHSYGVADAMYFSGCDSIDNLINTQGGAPFGDLDRMKYPVSNSPLFMLFGYLAKWDSVVQVRLASLSKLTVSILPTWTSATRNISAQINIHIISDLPSGDYRVSLYVVEDSVVGTGTGYDQENLYDTSPSGNPFFGMGNPIGGYAHRNVVRVALPSPLGQAGVLPANPMSGQDYSSTINYTLPASVNENKTSLVAFVYKYAPTGANNEMLNAEKAALMSTSTGISSTDNGSISDVYPNPTTGKIYFAAKDEFTLYDIIGIEIQKNISSEIDLSAYPSGIYFIRLQGNKDCRINKIVKI
jgi:hypothetical protein